MGFRSQLSAAQIAAIFAGGRPGDLDGGDPLSTFQDVDGGGPPTVTFDAIEDGGTP